MCGSTFRKLRSQVMWRVCLLSSCKYRLDILSSLILLTYYRAHGITANKRMGLTLYAEIFASLGYAVVLFDYRRWGTSGAWEPPSTLLLVLLLTCMYPFTQRERRGTLSM